MYAKYVSVVGATMANVLSDIARLIGGESIANLSASCDKTNSQVLFGSSVTGWTAHDIASPASAYGCIVKAPHADGVTTKYGSLSQFDATTFTLSCYEDFNNATHVGVNRSFILNQPGHRIVFSTTAVNTYYILATPRLLSVGSNFASETHVLVEFTREAKYLKNTSYPAFGVCSIGYYVNGWGIGIPRVKNPTAAGDITVNASAHVRGVGPEGGVPADQPTRDNLEQKYHQLSPAFASHAAGAGLYLGVIQDLYMTTKNYGVGGDEVVTADGEFFILTANEWRWALKKG